MQILTIITGTKHYGADPMAAVTQLREGDVLRLQREAGNKVDSNAVSVWRGEQFLGYVPRRDNRELARMLDNDGKANAVVIDRAIIQAGGILEDPRIRITCEETTAPGLPPRYETKPIPDHPQKLFGIWDRFTASFVEGEAHSSGVIGAAVARHNRAFEAATRE